MGTADQTIQAKGDDALVTFKSRSGRYALNNRFRYMIRNRVMQWR